MKEYTALFLFAGIGGGALGFLRSRLPDAVFTSTGAVDFDEDAAVDFQRLTGSPCYVGDIATMEPADLARICVRPPDVVFTSPPCKSFSGCLPAATARTAKYVDMSDLAMRGLFLVLEAWPGHVPRLILLENVPRIQNRGRHLLDNIVGMLQSYGYTCSETVRNCGELGGLAQRRRRFLLVARHMSTTSAWWREPPRQSMRGVGSVFGTLPLPLPGPSSAGVMHTLPRLSALNWLRLALIPAGGDWRDLPASVQLAERPGRQNGGFGVENWDEAAHAVLGEGTVRNVRASVADPRLDCAPRNGVMGVVSSDGHAGTVIGHADIRANAAAVADPRPGYDSRGGGHGVQGWAAPASTVVGSGPIETKGAAIADPRLAESLGRHSTKRAVSRWAEPAGTIMAAGSRDSGTGAPNVADPRLSASPGRHEAKYRVVDGSGPAGTVIASDRVGSGAPCVADPRPSLIGHASGGVHVADPRVICERHEGGHGVLRWDQHSYCMIGHPSIDNWPGQVADPRACGLEIGYIVETPTGLALTGVTLDLSDKRPLDNPPIILALDGTWHRPMTDLELALLQAFPAQLNGEWLVLTGSRAKRRESIGNAVPVATAEAIALSALRCLHESDTGMQAASAEPVWVDQESDATYSLLEG